MTSNSIARPAPAAVSHGTQVEQSRAVAEVFAAAELASRFPRDEDHAEARIIAACSRKSLAERAEYALPRGGNQAAVTGPSVHLARELARIWGNISHGVVEISRDPERGQSELLAYAWDVESNARSARVVIIPHTRDKTEWVKRDGRNVRGGTVQAPIDTQQDITNQNNSVAARQLREVIFSVLPQALTEDAIAACKATLVRAEQEAVEADQDTTGKALPERIRNAVDLFEANGVTRAQLEEWAGREGNVDRFPVDRWEADTLARVGVLYRSLERGDAKVADVWPPAPAPDLTAADLARPAPADDLGADLARPVDPLEPTDAEREAARQRDLDDQAEQDGANL
jgi:hypothetical protein